MMILKTILAIFGLVFMLFILSFLIFASFVKDEVEREMNKDDEE